MAYCRFSNADAYLFGNMDVGFECCSCSLAPLGRTVMTGGLRWNEYVRRTKEAKEKGESMDFGFSPYDKCPNCDGEGCEICWCPECQGKGCKRCMMNENTLMKTAEEALGYLLKHRETGHRIPDEAIEKLKHEIISGTEE